MSLEVYDNSGGREVHWLDKPRMFNTCSLSTYWVYASELEPTRCLQITGLPQYGSDMKFYGDTAKHIVGNWLN